MAREYVDKFLPNAAMTCDEFFRFLNQLKPAPQTIDAALSKLYSYRPNYMRHHSLVYLSRSLHGSSFENPRALLYGSNAKMVLTFNGSDDQANFERMELMCFNDSQKSFEFREITFPKEARDPNQLEDLSPQERKQNFVISPINGSPSRRCTACHHEPARPTWFTYPFWPGVYGSQDDFPQNYAQALKNNETEVQERFFEDIKKTEYNNWAHFEKMRPLKKRYRWIGGYLKSDTIFVDQPNLHLNILLQDLNHERVTAELLRKIKDLMPERFKVADAVYCSFESKIPRTVVSKTGEDKKFEVLKKPFDVLVKNILTADIEDLESQMGIMKFVLGPQNIGPLRFGNNREFQELVFELQQAWYQVPMPKDIIGISTLLDSEEILVAARLFPILTRYQIDIRNWAMKAEGDGYMFNDGQGSLSPALVRLVDGEFMDQLMIKDQEIFKLIQSLRNLKNPHQYVRPLCQKISQKLSTL